MAEEQGCFRVAGWMSWILIVTLTIWSDRGNGQGQGKWKDFIIERKYECRLAYSAGVHF